MRSLFVSESMLPKKPIKPSIHVPQPSPGHALYASDAGLFVLDVVRPILAMPIPPDAILGQFFPSSHTVRSEASGTTIIAPGKPAAQHSAHPLEQPTALSPMPCIMTTIFFGRVVLPK
eukprot:CAMPEP_0115314740 /NCGR_PEP_ID=MMETSP0270-20121206/77200_1 /TAXON_ID=71861 /ORGANISM="Scrippsiella trochoidea, Strain CCMP3099" /LENGTH=117 /DNA_ID=CAMNT_0002733999 /DNA_START=263 /DNA_END=617 /DNA_ORIENTATION=-